jgi:hypothetical protein
VTKRAHIRITLNTMPDAVEEFRRAAAVAPARMSGRKACKRCVAAVAAIQGAEMWEQRGERERQNLLVIVVAAAAAAKSRYIRRQLSVGGVWRRILMRISVLMEG